jgi:hypothetical protein
MIGNRALQGIQGRYLDNLCPRKLAGYDLSEGSAK